MSKNIEYVPVSEYMFAIRSAKAMETLLIQYMGEDAYAKWSTDLARELFAAEINDMEDNDFKEFCINNFEEITKSGKHPVIIDMTPYVDEEDEDDE